MTIFRIAGIALSACILAGCEGSTGVLTSTESGLVKGADLVDRDIKPLNATEVRVFLEDSTLSYQGELREWFAYLARDGVLYGLSKTAEGGEERARGTWIVQEDGQICRTWEGDWSGGDEGCAFVYRFGSQYVFAPEGTPLEGAIRRDRTPGDSARIL